MAGIISHVLFHFWSVLFQKFTCVYIYDTAN